MTYLTALVFAKQRDEIQETIERTLRSSLQDYLDFLPERGSSWVPHHKDAIDYTYTELDGRNFLFESEEYYHYGENEKDYISLPFEFVETPETFKERILKEISDAEKKRIARTIADKAERVRVLKQQLASAESNLAKAQEKDDLIGTVALTKQTGEIRSALHRQGN